MKQVSVRQLELLIDFMENHEMLALGRVRGREGHILSNKLWTELAAILNCDSVDPSFYRSPKEWNKFYNDYKCRIKNKARKIGQSQRKTGGGPADSPPLTELEQRLCCILGNKFNGLPVRQIPLLTTVTEAADITSIEHTNIGESPIFDYENIEILESETPSRIVEENTTSVIGIPLDDIQPSTSSQMYVGKAKTKQPSPSHGSSKKAKQTDSQSTIARELRVTEVEKNKNILADIEKARLNLNQAQIQAHLERNAIEKDKVKAINNLASAAWALVNIFNNNNQEGNKRKYDGSSTADETVKRSRSQSSD